MASEEDLKAEIERLRAENEALKKPARGQMSLKVSEKGGLSVYGLGRFPVTLYREQWEKLLGMADEIRNFILENDTALKKKEYPAFVASGAAADKLFRVQLGPFGEIKDAEAIGFTIGALSRLDPARERRNLSVLMAWLAAGRITPHVSHRLPLEKAAEALTLVRERKVIGKAVLV